MEERWNLGEKRDKIILAKSPGGGQVRISFSFRLKHLEMKAQAATVTPSPPFFSLLPPRVRSRSRTRLGPIMVSILRR